MVRTRDILSALRVAAIWLLVMSVCFGPTGRGASSASTCGMSCPCHEAMHDDRIEDHAAHSVDASSGADEGEAGGHEDEAPGDDKCPDNCPNCICCLGVAMAVIPLAIPSTLRSSASICISAPPETPANGACTGVFRPPRSRA